MHAMTAPFDLVVTRKTLEARSQPANPGALQAGHIRLSIDMVALTANNVTYGVAADQLGYWDFFPTPDAADGRIPVWGFADVTESRCPEIATGARVYGFLPMSSYVDVRPGGITPAGFNDISAHRANRAPIYNHYTLCDHDPLWSTQDEPLIALYRPLFTTAFLLEEFHRDNGYFGAANLVIASASSKTAIGLARLICERAPGNITVRGLTSAANAAFCEALGCYDRVYTYDDVRTLPQQATAFVDMAGNAGVRRAVHEHLGETLLRSTAVGMTHWTRSSGLGEDLPGARPSFFFAPSYAQDRVKHWGRDGFQARYADAWRNFQPFATEHTKVQRHCGPDAIRTVFNAMRDGQIDPRTGIILSPR